MSSPFLVIPPTLARWFVPRQALNDTRDMLADPGQEGHEAAVLWLGWVMSETAAQVATVYFPHQVAYHTEEGVAVEIPVEEWTDLALRLPPGAFVLAKVHTHPGVAYHSEADVANPYLSHEGAVSITVPDFARAAMHNLMSCSVNVFRIGQWQEMSPVDIQRAFIIEERAT